MIIQTKTSAILTGKVSKVEYKVTDKGCPILSFTLKYGKDAEDSKKSLFANCKCFYEKAKAYKHLPNGFEVVVFGERQSREYQGKVYEDVLVDLICNGLQFAVEEEQPEEVLTDNIESSSEMPF